MVAADGNSAPAAAVIDERIDGFLEHAFFIADDDFRGADIYQMVQSVVAVDNPAVKVVKVGGGKPAAVQLYHGSEVGGQDGEDGQNHPLRFIPAITESLHDP